MRLGGDHKTKLNYSTYQTKFVEKITKMKLHCEYDYDCIRKTRLYYLLIFLHSSARVSWGGVQLFKSFCHIIINEIKCLGFLSPKKGMLISVLSPAGYFFPFIQN